MPNKFSIAYLMTVANGGELPKPNKANIETSQQQPTNPKPKRPRMGSKVNK